VAVVIRDWAADVVLVLARARVPVVIRGSATAVLLVQVEGWASQAGRDLDAAERAILIETAV
jgi:hypothetical protein